jgi:HEAT repeat protein
MGRRAALSIVLGCVVAGAAFAEQDGTAVVEEMLAEGHFREAYAATGRDGGPPDAQGLDRLSRALLKEATRSDDNYVRWFAMRAMRTLEDRDLAAAARPLADSEDRYVQALALEVLANADPQGSRDVFLAKLESPFRTVRLRALRGLERLKDPATISRLGTVLANDDDPEIRALAARTLGSIGSRLAIAVLKPALDDANELVREETVAALVRLGDETIPAVVIERLAGAAPGDRVGVIHLAGLVPDPRVVAALGPLLGDGDPEVRAFAAGAILSIQHRLSGATGGR